MLKIIVATFLILLLMVGIADARAADADPADYLPSGAAIRQTARGDVDGDGRDDLVALYSLQGAASAPIRASLLILLATDDGVRPVHLFGAPPEGLRGEPTLDPAGSTDLALSDLNGDGIGEIQLSVNVQYQEPKRRTLLWVFGRGDGPVRSDDNARPFPPWAGTGFRLEVFLEGTQVTAVAPGPLNPDRTVALRREAEERRLGGPDPALDVSETYVWRDGGYRLGMRSLTLPAETGSTARAPETAVLAFYNAVAAGDLQSATNLLGDDLQASRSANPAGDPTASERALRVEEIRTVDEYVGQRMRSDTERLVYVRVSLDDSRVDPPPPSADAESVETAPQSLLPRQTIAGTWRTQKVGEQWRLVAADLHETANLDAISASLPPGATVVQTAGADLRGLGTEDIVVLANGPGRYATLEPYVILVGAAGPVRAVPLGSFVEGGVVGAVGGTIRADDVNADGKPEITFSAFVGAHSALLWVLQWDGSTFAPLFAEASNSPAIDLTDLDGDGIAEIVLGQSGYCGSYAASPRMAFAFRWENGAYRSASMRYPSLNDGIDEHAAGILTNHLGDGRDDARACVQHMLATANAFRGRPADARTAYRTYAQHRQQTPDPSRSFVRPIYHGAPYLEADLRAVLAAAVSGEPPGWGSAEHAILHDLLGDALIDRARGYQFEAERAAERGDQDQAREARRKASEARQAATREYQAALELDPTDEEARRALGE
jgi:hypothetical protein